MLYYKCDKEKQESEIQEILPARELKNPNPFGLRIIRTTQNSQYSTHDFFFFFWIKSKEMDKQLKEREKRLERTR